jgi:hypothetical protein
MLRCRNSFAPRLGKVCALAAGVCVVIGSSELGRAQEAPPFSFSNRFEGERLVPIFAQPQNRFDGSLTNGRGWSSPDQPSLLDPTPMGSLDAPSAELRRTHSADPPQQVSAPSLRARQQQEADPAYRDASVEGRRSGAAAAMNARSGNERSLGRGLAAWYEHPGRTASGEVYKPDGLTAAHRTLPLGTRLRVLNPRNGRSVVVRINDRYMGPRRIAVDLSRGAARRLGIVGIGSVTLSVVSTPEAATSVAQNSP